MIWDDTRHRCIGEISFGSEVRSVRLRRDRVVVVLDHKTAVHDFRNLERLHEFQTAPNPKGLCEITQQLGAMVMVCLGWRKGQVRVDDSATKRTTFISAHDSRIACLSMSQDGRFVATASSKGTLVRVFCSVDGTLLQELRRGADRAEIYSLAFSDDVQYLAVSSDKGTVHVFNLNVNLGVTWTNKPHPTPDSNIPAAKYPFSFIKGVLPKYFNSEWSVAQFRLLESTQYLVGFGHQKNTIIILGMDGRFYRCEFDPTIGGEMKQLEYYYFLDPDSSTS